MDTPDKEFLYAHIANRIEQQIRQKLYKAGDKLPSVRALSEEQQISISTAYKAYVELENMGLIEARPKSGYYVKFAQEKFSKLPSVQLPLKQIEQSDVSQLITLVYQQISGEGVVGLSRAAPPTHLIPVAKLNKSMMEALRSSASGNTNYEHLQGNISLRRQLAKNAFNWGGRVTEEDIVTTQGCMEALVFSLRAITKPGDTVAIESPAYFGIFNLMLSLDLKVLEIPVDPDAGLNIEYLEEAIEKFPVKACLFVPNFSNPTGCVMPDQRKQQLVKLLTAKRIPLIEDDIYGEIYFGRSRPKNCKSYDTDGWVILCSSVSKSIAPGYRVGWCIPGRFKELVLNIKMMHTITSATPTQAAIAHFFETGRYDLHMRNLRKALYEQCLRYMQGIVNYFPAGTKISRPQGGYALWIELDKQLNAFEIYQQAIHQQISIAPGQIFSTDGRFSHFIRISYGGVYDEMIDKSLQVLGSIINASMEKLEKEKLRDVKLSVIP
jgi:DNA-binding transcriptional MocR family regulator